MDGAFHENMILQKQLPVPSCGGGKTKGFYLRGHRGRRGNTEASKNQLRGTWDSLSSVQRMSAAIRPQAAAVTRWRKGVSIKSARMPETKIRMKGNEPSMNPATAWSGWAMPSPTNNPATRSGAVL